MKKNVELPLTEDQMNYLIRKIESKDDNIENKNNKTYDYYPYPNLIESIIYGHINYDIIKDNDES